VYEGKKFKKGEDEAISDLSSAAHWRAVIKSLRGEGTKRWGGEDPYKVGKGSQGFQTGKKRKKIRKQCVRGHLREDKKSDSYAYWEPGRKHEVL